MKSGIMGAHGTGKTTLATKMAGVLEETGIRCRLVSGVARSCPLPINRDGSEESQRWIFHRQVLGEIEAQAEAEAVFCDRTVIDGLVYAQVLGLRQVVDDYLDAALRWLESYDALYWCRPRAGWLKDDGQRDTDPGWQAVVDAEFCDWIVRYGLPVVEVSNEVSNGE